MKHWLTYTGKFTAVYIIMYLLLNSVFVHTHLIDGKLYGYFAMQYTPDKKFTASLTGTYSGKMLVQHMESSGTETDIAVTTPSFFDMNLKLAKDFSLFQGVTLQANCGVMNIFNSFQDDFDKGVDRDSGYMYGPMMPRSMYAGIKLSW